MSREGRDQFGSKGGSSGIASDAVRNAARRAAMNRLTTELLDLNRDPYFSKNHLGQIECKLCYSRHVSEANYISHAQSRKHQVNMAQRAKRLGQRDQRQNVNANANANQRFARARNQLRMGQVRQRKAAKHAGLPAYKLTKSVDDALGWRRLCFEVSYPHVGANVQPRHRFMSAFEQRVDVQKDARYQYLVLAAEPYQNIAFKIPSDPIVRDRESPEALCTYWNPVERVFTLRLTYGNGGEASAKAKGQDDVAALATDD
jgi:splicing factor 3A subunit 2